MELVIGRYQGTALSVYAELDSVSCYIIDPVIQKRKETIIDHA
jgi:hypothetical protein